MIGFNGASSNPNYQAGESSDEDKVQEYIEIDKKAFKDEESPDLTNYQNIEHDKLVRKYNTLYNDCGPSRKIVERLNLILFKNDIDKYLDEQYSFTEGMMGFFINYLINYQRLQNNDNNDLQTYFLLYSSIDNTPVKNQTYHPTIENLKKFEYAHLQLLQPSIEEFKKRIETNNIEEVNHVTKNQYKYIALVINGSSKWFLCLYDLKFKEAYFMDQAYEQNTDVLKYDNFFEVLVKQELGLNVKGQVIHQIIDNIKNQGDRGDLTFYTLFRLLISKIKIDLNADFLSPNDIKRAKTRCTWLILKQMKMERDLKEDKREQKRSYKKYMQLQMSEQEKQSEIDKKNLALKNEKRKKLKEQLLFNHMLNDATQEIIEKKEKTEAEIQYQLLLKKLAVFNVHTKGNRQVSELEGWISGKKSQQPDYYYNFSSQIPQEIKGLKRDNRSQIQPQNYYSNSGYNHKQQKKQLPQIRMSQYQSVLPQSIPPPKMLHQSQSPQPIYPQYQYPRSLQESMYMNNKLTNNNHSQKILQIENYPQQPTQNHHNSQNIFQSENVYHYQPPLDNYHSQKIQRDNNLLTNNNHSQKIFQNDNIYPYKPSSRDLKRRWHYAQNLQKMQPSQYPQQYQKF